MNKTVHSMIALIVGCAASAAASAASFPNLGNIDFNRAGTALSNAGTALTGVSEKDEIALGRELAGRTMGAAPLVNDARLQRYVNQVGRAIAAQSDRPELPWRFGIIDTPSVNAFAAPGGTILVTRGLYEALDNEAQLAAVLGHEVAHVMKRHHVNVVRQQATGQAIAGGTQTFLQATGRDRTGLADKFLGTGAELFTKQLDQGAEYESDSVGLQLATKAGYSPVGMVELLQKLQARAGQPSSNLLFETHPHPNDRLAKVGDILEPQMATLPAGKAPPLQVAASSLPAPVKTAGQPAPTAGRALSSQSRQQQPAPQQEAPEAASSLTGGPSGNPAEAAGQLLRGLFGR